MSKFKYAGLFAALALFACATVSAAAPRVLKLAHAINEQDAFHIGALKLKDVVDKESNGQLSVEIFPNGKLGDERTLLENIRMGVVDMAIITGGPIINFMPEFGIFDLPFLFRNEEHAYKVLDGEFGQNMLKKMEKAGWKGLAYGERGFRNLTNSKRSVKVPSDMNGLKIRLMENPIYVDTFRALGANAVPMAWIETLTALQQGALDGQENPLNVIWSYKLYECQKYLSLTNHTYAPNVIMMSLRCWNSLKPEQQALIMKAAKAGAKANRDMDLQKNAEWLADLEKHGMVVTKPDLEAFRKAVAPIYDKYMAKFGKDTVQGIINTK